MSRTYTVAEANDTLPYVRSIVAEVQERYRTIQERSHLLRAVPKGDASAQADLKAEIKEQARRIAACIAELGAIGVELKSHETGLVDFPAELEGRPIQLCWKHGEAAIGHWHETRAGFAGRQPVPDDQPTWPGKKGAEHSSSLGGGSAAQE